MEINVRKIFKPRKGVALQKSKSENLGIVLEN